MRDWTSASQGRTLRPELLRLAGTLLAAVVIVIGIMLDQGPHWFLLAVVVYGLSTALFGLAVVRNWRGVASAYRRSGAVGFTGWAQLAIGIAMMLGAVMGFVATR